MCFEGGLADFNVCVLDQDVELSRCIHMSAQLLPMQTNLSDLKLS